MAAAAREHRAAALQIRTNISIIKDLVVAIAPGVLPAAVLVFKIPVPVRQLLPADVALPAAVDVVAEDGGTDKLLVATVQENVPGQRVPASAIMQNFVPAGEFSAL
jgi:hypothetical protein